MHITDYSCKPLIRTNTALSGNVQLIVDESYKCKYNTLTDNVNVDMPSTEATYAYNASKLWSSLKMGNESIFNVKKSDILTADTVSAEEQYDMQYMQGAYYTTTANKFRYFAPLFVTKYKQPKYFLLFRCNNNTAADVSLQTLLKDAELINRWSLDKIDLTYCIKYIYNRKIKLKQNQIKLYKK
jgi:hypothetical protein